MSQLFCRGGREELGRDLTWRQTSGVGVASVRAGSQRGVLPGSVLGLAAGRDICPHSSTEPQSPSVTLPP
jgi:hypothetical protein